MWKILIHQVRQVGLFEIQNEKCDREKLIKYN